MRRSSRCRLSRVLRPPPPQPMPLPHSPGFRRKLRRRSLKLQSQQQPQHLQRSSSMRRRFPLPQRRRCRPLQSDRPQRLPPSRSSPVASLPCFLRRCRLRRARHDWCLRTPTRLARRLQSRHRTPTAAPAVVQPLYACVPQGRIRTVLRATHARRGPTGGASPSIM